MRMIVVLLGILLGTIIFTFICIFIDLKWGYSKEDQNENSEEETGEELL